MRICITRLYTLCRYPNTFLFEKNALTLKQKS